MLKKLRLKFIALSTGLLFMLLSVILFAINLINYRSVIAYCDSVTDILSENRGRFPEPDHFKNDFRKNPRFSGELPYEARFFTVRFDREGNVLFTDTGKIASVDSAAAISYAQKAFSGGKKTGFLETYRYRVSKDIGGTLIVFLDCGRKLDDFYFFRRTSIGITFGGFAVVFVLIWIFSKRIMRPFAENYEKQKQFITDAGHELKTPLTVINADADVLAAELGEQNEWLTDIQKQTARMTEMTNSLISLARAQEDGMHTQMIDFPLSDVIAETAQSFQTLAVSRQKTFRTDIEPMLSFHGDDKGMRQLVSILLDNAVKYSGENGEILLSLRRAGNSIRLDVQNTCEAISREDLKHLFDRFFRTDRSRNSDSGGFGIGLSIAKSIVSAHKGTIRASAPNEHSLLITAIFPAGRAGAGTHLSFNG